MIQETGAAPKFKYVVTCTKADGSIRWSEDFSNLVTTEGKNHLLTQYFKGSAYTAAWYCGLISSSGYSAVDATDTASSHAGWTESTAYSESVRQTVTFGTAAAGSLATSSACAFSINGTDTIKGAFVISNSTKSGTTGTLYSAGLFTTGDRAVLSGDTVNVSITMSA